MLIICESAYLNTCEFFVLSIKIFIHVWTQEKQVLFRMFGNLCTVTLLQNHLSVLNILPKFRYFYVRHDRSLYLDFIVESQ